ncbi:MAG TPA: molybdopterin cofactor-binding domain-containing protein, partial [Bryobacteraceae bacterium]|nr:molybdopterin cofactor-binding domain-containing protein [Bryobacteraceae bacterium]
MDDLTVTRRGFVTSGGALFVSLQLPVAIAGLVTTGTQHSPDPAQLASWLEIRGDNSVLVRTGRTETGTGMSGYYTQVIAEELNIRPESVSLLMGDTDRTPDGGYSAGFIYGMSNVRKVAAYAYQALLGLAAAQLGVPVSSLNVVDAVVHGGGGKTITYGELVRGQHLDLKIPVTGRPARADPTGWVGMTALDGYSVGGDPPLKPVSRFKVIGTSFPVPGIPDKVTGKTRWSCDVRLPGMLHARMVRPATLGSTLISPGRVDKSLFPTATVVRKGNLVAVLSPNEWEAVNAARSVAADTQWTNWSGLPGSENLTQAFRQQKWSSPESKGNASAVTTALARAFRTITATYEQAYVRHAPIGAFVAVADVRSDGSVTVWTHSAQSQGLRARLAHMLSAPVEKVVVRWLEHSGQYGRTTLGGDGAEADAVILSQLTGKPVRVQWTLQEDLAWSTASPGWVCDGSAALDARGNLTALRTAFYSPHMFDPRPVGALLAGMPCNTSKPGGFIATEWPYDKIPNRLEEAYGMANLGDGTVSGGLRGHIMRTPGQRQQNFVQESLLNEAAAAAHADPIQFRIRHTSEQRLIDV